MGASRSSDEAWPCLCATPCRLSRQSDRRHPQCAVIRLCHVVSMTHCTLATSQRSTSTSSMQVAAAHIHKRVQTKDAMHADRRRVAARQKVTCSQPLIERLCRHAPPRTLHQRRLSCQRTMTGTRGGDHPISLMSHVGVSETVLSESTCLTPSPLDYETIASAPPHEQLCGHAETSARSSRPGRAGRAGRAGRTRALHRSPCTLGLHPRPTVGRG